MNFKEKLNENRPLIGTFQALPSPDVTEILAGAGFDWLFIDGEHSAMNALTIQRILQAGQHLTPCVVRTPSYEETNVKKILDAGADGIIFPLTNTPEMARHAVDLCKYPPIGNRSAGLGRAQGYGSSFQQYVETANDSVALIIQVEHIEAVKHIEEMVKIEGIDGVFIGPYDLSASMGKIGQVNDKEVQDNIEKVRQTCVNAGMPVGIFTANPNDVKQFIQQNYCLICAGVDAMFLNQKLQEFLEKTKK